MNDRTEKRLINDMHTFKRHFAIMTVGYMELEDRLADYQDLCVENDKIVSELEYIVNKSGKLSRVNSKTIDEILTLLNKLKYYV